MLLSSRLTLPARVAYTFAIIWLAAWATVSVADGSFGVQGVAWRAALLGAIAIGAAFLLRVFSFMTVHLDGDHVIVRGLWSARRLPASSIQTVAETSSAGLGMVTVRFASPQPGLGRGFRFLSRTFPRHPGSEAELLLVTSRARRPGA